MDKETWRRGKVLALLVVLLLMINLPLVDGWRRDRQLSADGADVVARVTDHAQEGERHLLTYELPERDGLSPGPYPAVMEPAAWQEAVNSGEVTVRVLPDVPMARRVEGEQQSNLGLVLTPVGDAAVLAFALLLWRSGRYRRRAEDTDDERADGAQTEEHNR